MRLLPSPRTAVGWLDLVAAALALTFSYTAVAAPASALRQSVLVVTSVWTLAVLAGHVLLRRHRHRSAASAWRLAPAWWSRLLVLLVLVTVPASLLWPAPGRTRADLIRITVIAVIGEEALSRGLIWDLVQEVSRRRHPAEADRDRAGLVVTSALFALSHLQYSDYRLTPTVAGQLGYTLIAGLGLGWLRARTGSLAPSALLHASGNAVLKLVALA